MATIPIYDETTLPCITYPYSNTRQPTKKYLGRRAVVGEVTATINLIATSDAEVLALNTFFESECNFGLEPFLINLPILGVELPEQAATLAKFIGEVTDTKNANGTWTASRQLKVLGTIIYVIDDQDQFILSDEGDFIFADNGDYLSTGTPLNAYREITWQTE